MTNPLISSFDARLIAGFYRPDEYRPDKHYFLPYLESEPEVRCLLRLITFLGIPEHGEELEFPLTLANHQAFTILADVYKLQLGSYVCIDPGARLLSQRNDRLHESHDSVRSGTVRYRWLLAWGAARNAA